MNLVVGISIGAVVGIAGGLWLMLNLIAIRVSLSKGGRGTTAQIGAILTLPAFVGGSTWAANSFFANVFVSDVLVAYSVSSLLLITSINVLPCYRLVIWAAHRMGET